MKGFWSMVRSWLLATSVVALTACGGDNGGVEVSGGFGNQGGTELLADTFGATLTPTGLLPPNASAATGAGTIVIDPFTREMVAVVTTTGLDPTTVTLREGAPGTAGDIVLPLFETAPGSGIWTATAALTDAQIEALRRGNFFFDVASLAFPGGELAGRILPQLATFDGSPFAGIGGVPLAEFGAAPSQPVTLVAALRGNQAVPATTSLAQGSATVVVNPLTRQVVAAVATRGIVPTQIEIGLGAPGVDGTTILPLTETGLGTGVWQARGVLSVEEINALLAGEGFIVVSSAAFPQGEIRGQLIPLRETPGLVGTPLPAVPLVPTFIDDGLGVGGFGTPTVPGVGTSGFTPPGIDTDDDPFNLENDPFDRGPLGPDPFGSAPLGGFQTDPNRLGITPGTIGLTGSVPGTIGVTGTTPGTIGLTGTVPGTIGIGDPLTPAPGLTPDPFGTSFGTPLGTPLGAPLNTSPNDLF